MAKLRLASFAEVAPFKSAAARDHVSVSETRETYWFLYEDAGEMIGFCALLRTTLGGRVKGVWVKPELRGKGHGREMTLALIKQAINELFFLRLEALAHNPGFYEELGWKRVGLPMPNGAVRLARNY
jgi:ribosomal protein S18 acetylase RimI-like enzyme